MKNSKIGSSYTSGTIPDVVKVSDSEEVRDKDTDSNVVECGESFVCAACILKMYLAKTKFKVFTNLATCKWRIIIKS